MSDPIQALCQLLFEQLKQDPAVSSEQMVTRVKTQLAANPALTQALQEDRRIAQVNSGDSEGFQTLAYDGGVANVGTHFHMNAQQLAEGLGKLLQEIAGQNKPTGTPQNLTRSSAVQFVGREDRLRELHDQMQQGDRIAITSIVGMGGLGKTELALQYAIAQNQAGSYPGGICWLRARDEEVATQITSFARVHLGLSVPDGLNSEEQVRYCWQRWPVGEVLIVIDDVTAYAEVLPYLPPSESRFKVLMTTRLELGRAVRRFTIQVLDEGSAMMLLESLVGESRIRAEVDEAKSLCAWVGYLPLGLRLLGQSLADDPYSSVYVLLGELEEVGLDAEALRGITNELGVLQTLELSWQALNEQEQALACLLGMFALAPIPWDLVEQCFCQVNQKELRESNKGLLNRSLLNRVGNGFYQLHQIVQEFFRVKLRQRGDEGNSIKAEFGRALVKVAQGIEYGSTLDKVNEVRASIVHLEELGARWLDSLSDEDLVWPFLGIVYFYQSQGLYNFAVPWGQKCLEKTKGRLGESHLYVSLSLNNLASLYQDQGKYEAAEPLFQAALAMKKQLLGDTHPEVATNLNNLANLYRDQGKYEAAEPLYQESLAMYKQLLGDTHPEVATSLNNLASLYRNQGKYEAAEPLYQDALAMRKQLLGDTHPEVAISLHNLARLYRKQGKYEAAEPLFQDALAMRKQLLGNTHPDVATSQYNLGVLYQKQGDYRRAKALYLEALSVAQSALGPNHPRTQNIQSWLDSLPPDA